MVQIRINTDLVRDTGNRLLAEAQTLQEEANQLKGTAYGLDTGEWSGTHRVRIEPLLGEVMPRAGQVAQQLNELGQKLVRVADVFEERDGSAAQNLAGLPWVDFDSGQVIATPGIFTSLIVGWHQMRAFFDPYEISESMDYLESTNSGQELLELAQDAGIAFRLPDGTIIGDENGRIVDVRFEDTSDIQVGGQAAGGGYTGDYDGNPETDDPTIIVSNNTWASRHLGLELLAGKLGHEIQHAVDDAEGLMEQPEQISSFLNDPDKLEAYLGDVIQTHVESEVRAYKRGSTIENSTAFYDDGELSYDEADFVMHDNEYEAYYETVINKNPELQAAGYEVDFWIDQDGDIQATVSKVMLEVLPGEEGSVYA